ncbi:MAG: hypothetical protein CSA09_01410 [Candidatus Contendobacter odensis]|uniref:Uncharacterized protein n=1 Tax=Candidatus Contendibacter odensensis TaxID=1400860 RepID=A0A2G6PG65_9GAMM|nr:MAG: hypothetical protein CSA09_01410 [Candidatus Contendobacter odensis]
MLVHIPVAGFTHKHANRPAVATWMPTSAGMTKWIQIIAGCALSRERQGGFRLFHFLKAGFRHKNLHHPDSGWSWSKKQHQEKNLK